MVKDTRRIKGCGRYTNLWDEVTTLDHSRGLVVNEDCLGPRRCGAWSVKDHWQVVCRECMVKSGLRW